MVLMLRNITSAHLKTNSMLPVFIRNIKNPIPLSSKISILTNNFYYLFKMFCERLCHLIFQNFFVGDLLQADKTGGELKALSDPIREITVA